MPKYVVERKLPGAGALSKKELQEMSQTFCEVLMNMDPQIQWIHSYVTDNKMYCIFLAPDVNTILEHASYGGFPVSKVSRIYNVIDPSTAE